jgi:hypothetical protein
MLKMKEPPNNLLKTKGRKSAPNKLMKIKVLLENWGEARMLLKGKRLGGVRIENCEAVLGFDSHFCGVQSRGNMNEGDFAFALCLLVCS